MRTAGLIKVNLEDFKENSIYIRSKKGERDRTVLIPKWIS